MFADTLTTDCPICHARVLIPKLEEHLKWHQTIDGWIEAHNEAEAGDDW